MTLGQRNSLRLPKAINCAWHTYSENLITSLNLYEHQWLIEVKNLLKQAIALKKKMTIQEYHTDNSKRDEIENRLDRLLETVLNEKHKKMLQRRASIFQFLYHHKVPPDNNASERARRNVKVKQKVSGQFKSFRGAQSFAIIRSIIDTAIKRNINVMECLSLNAQIVPE